jgi:hypothetical protein
MSEHGTVSEWLVAGSNNQESSPAEAMVSGAGGPGASPGHASHERKLSDTLRGLAVGARIKERWGCLDYMQACQWETLAAQVAMIEDERDIAQCQLRAIMENAPWSEVTP